MNEETKTPETKTESKPVVKETKTAPAKAAKSSKVAVILIRGLIGIRHDIKETLFMLRLRKKHTCVVLDNNPTTKGMFRKIKDYVTFGEVSDETVKELESVRGKKDVNGNLKPFFELAPPKGGFERKGTKKPFTVGGVLGYRGEKMNDLVRKML